MIDKDQLIREGMALGISMTEQQVNAFALYADLLLEWNEKMNLTAITKPEEIVTKHFCDSLTLLKALEIPENAAMIDVGTGAGFPSIPIKIMRPDVHVTLLDSLNKRLLFLQAVSEQLGQDNCTVHFRAEEAGQKEQFRERYDLATARAVAHLRELSEYCLPFVRVGGYFAAMKSSEIEVELAESRNAIGTLGGKLIGAKAFQLADGSARSILVVKKISQSSTKYPRPHAKMVKSPLK